MKYENFDKVKKIMAEIGECEERLEALNDSPDVSVEKMNDVDASDKEGLKIIESFIDVLRIHYMDKINNLKKELDKL